MGGAAPAPLRDGLDNEALTPVFEGRGVVCEQRLKRASVHEGRRLGPGKIGEGRCEVVVEHHVMQSLTFGHARTAYDERYTYVLFVGRPFSGAQPVLAQMEAVVGGEYYVSVIQLAAVVQRFDEVSYHVVHGQHGLQPLAVELFHVYLLLQAQRWVVAYPAGLV